MKTLTLSLRIIKLVGFNNFLKFVKKINIPYTEFHYYAEDYNDKLLNEIIFEIIKYGKLLEQL